VREAFTGVRRPAVVHARQDDEQRVQHGIDDESRSARCRARGPRDDPEHTRSATATSSSPAALLPVQPRPRKMCAPRSESRARATCYLFHRPRRSHYRIARVSQDSAGGQDRARHKTGGAEVRIPTRSCTRMTPQYAASSVFGFTINMAIGEGDVTVTQRSSRRYSAIANGHAITSRR